MWWPWWWRVGRLARGLRCRLPRGPVFSAPGSLVGGAAAGLTRLLTGLLSASGVLIGGIGCGLCLITQGLTCFGAAFGGVLGGLVK